VKSWVAQLVKRAAALAGLALGLAGSGSAYYHFVHFSGHSGPFTAMVEKFDLTLLNNKTIRFFISDQGPSQLLAGDSFLAVISEVRTAADTWNQVATSDLRISYGGLYKTGANGSAPAIHVDFSDDIPPGLLALGGVESLGPPTTGPDGNTFFPIQSGKLLLPRDMTATAPPSFSFSELFFTTLVHEFGHALGLQHSMASAVMSTAITSGATRARPLGSDDVAGLSLLYPTADYRAGVGSISGRVTLGKNGVNLASVVAISTAGGAVGALTNPDGTYRIDGLPTNQPYLVYAHPLPPPLQGESTPANLRLPQYPDGFFDVGPVFAAQFYPGTRDWTQAQWISVNPGANTTGVNFSVSARGFTPLHSVRTYGFSSTQTGMTPPAITLGATSSIAAWGVGLLRDNGTVTPGLNIAVLGSLGTVNSPRPYPPPYDTTYLAMEVAVTNPVAGAGPKHLLFMTRDDMYVLPAGLNAVAGPPPGITSITPGVDAGGNSVVTISGTNLSSDTRIFFDGLPGVTENVTKDGKLVVAPPPGPGGYTATVVALTPSDGQSSLYLQGSSPSTYTYNDAATPSVTVSPDYIGPNSDTQVEIIAPGANFVDGQTVVGFGSSDVQVKKIVVASPSHLFVTAIAQSAYFPTTSLSITTGLRVISPALGYQVAPPSSTANR
jgi:hypothetical protein